MLADDDLIVIHAERSAIIIDRQGATASRPIFKLPNSLGSKTRKLCILLA
jgi:hypothetical protein